VFIGFWFEYYENGMSKGAEVIFGEIYSQINDTA
jgi:hypothetical protein